MVRSGSASSAEIAFSITRLESKVRDMALDAGVSPAECSDLEATLEALPYVAQRRVTMLLQGTRLQADLSENPAMVTAAGFILALAQEIWRDGQNRTVAVAKRKQAEPRL